MQLVKRLCDLVVSNAATLSPDRNLKPPSRGLEKRFEPENIIHLPKYHLRPGTCIREAEIIESISGSMALFSYQISESSAILLAIKQSHTANASDQKLQSFPGLTLIHLHPRCSSLICVPFNCSFSSPSTFWLQHLHRHSPMMATESQFMFHSLEPHPASHHPNTHQL